MSHTTRISKPCLSAGSALSGLVGRVRAAGTAGDGGGSAAPLEALPPGRQDAWLMGWLMADGLCNYQKLPLKYVRRPPTLLLGGQAYICQTALQARKLPNKLGLQYN